MRHRGDRKIVTGEVTSSRISADRGGGSGHHGRGHCPGKSLGAGTQEPQLVWACCLLLSKLPAVSGPGHSEGAAGALPKAIPASEPLPESSLQPLGHQL